MLLLIGNGYYLDILFVQMSYFVSLALTLLWYIPGISQFLFAIVMHVMFCFLFFKFPFRMEEKIISFCVRKVLHMYNENAWLVIYL